MTGPGLFFLAVVAIALLAVGAWLLVKGFRRP